MTSFKRLPPKRFPTPPSPPPALLRLLPGTNLQLPYLLQRGLHPAIASTTLLTPFACVVALFAVATAGSDAPRGVAVGFVFDINAKCEPPCEHAGVCIRNNTCFCSRGYEGESCQYANCFPKCKNGGVCLRPGKCRCLAGFGGRYCHKVTCDGGCWNGGECTAVNGVAKCICPSSWTGSKCQEAICPQGCRNGGSCVAPGICSCPEGWLGGACHTAVCSQPCLNGGKCISPDKCRCRSPFSGVRCEERKKFH
ncbi:von Willebrand factor D and EGF domain-containing protein-like [Solea senegalensis]|uniref:von Willebrand factor D and EGF domain-containing protein-like n=1 Tax=Solea senegalensis TaxID=28829 RepID=A0AAV6PT03_SOLSE|nr:von Willebrand factor D and EGF domain-containing protein-like [Solea senegalensis]